jgi:hypothetical protein
MHGQPAFIFMKHELEDMLKSTARHAAQEVIEAFRAELSIDPTETHIRKLRAFIADRSTVTNPRELWANGKHIRSIRLSSKEKPLSTSWFHHFKRDSGLGDCISRKSQTAGGHVEWCFEDIANAWEQHQF